MIRLKTSQTPGPNRVTSERKFLDEGAKTKLLDLLTKCWEGEE